MKARQAIPLPFEDQESAKEQPFDRALSVLDVITKVACPVSVTDIAGECGLPVPTVHRLVGQLERRGWLKRVLGSKKVVVGPGLLRLGVAAIDSALRNDRPHQILVALASRIGEHCQIALRLENSLLYVDTVRALRSTGLHFEHGRRSPLHCTSIGKLFLAELPEADFDSWLAHATLESLAPRTIVKPADVRAEIKKVRKEGWAMNNEELAAGVIGCAVPIRDFDGRLLAGLGISVPSARSSVEELKSFRFAMESAAADIASAVLAND